MSDTHDATSANPTNASDANLRQQSTEGSASDTEQTQPPITQQTETASVSGTTEPVPHAAMEAGSTDEANTASSPVSKWQTCFLGFARLGPIVILLAIACSAWPDFWHGGNGLFCPPESQSVSAFLHSMAQNSWIAPVGLDNGAWSAALWPVFFWLAGLIALIPGVTETGLAIPITTTFCACLAVISVWALGCAARFGKNAAFAGAAIMFCTPLFAPFSHFFGPQLFSSALLALALAFFCNGWLKDRAFFSLTCAFALTALASLSGGPFYAIVPLAASFCFLIWRGKFKRAQKPDALFGFVLMLVIWGIWLGAIILGNGHDNYLNLLFTGIFHFSWPLENLWWRPYAAIIIGTLPWILLVFGVSWHRVIARAGASLGASRRDNGSAFLWIALVICLLMALVTPQFPFALTALFCIATPLLGKALTNFSGWGNRFFFLLASLTLICVGVLILMASFEATQNIILSVVPLEQAHKLLPRLLTLPTLPIMGGIVTAGGLLALFFVKRNRQCGGLVYGMALTIILCQPAILRLVPELGAMPDTRLVSYASIEGAVATAVASPQAQPEQLPASQPDAHDNTAETPTEAVTDKVPADTGKLPEKPAPEESAADNSAEHDNADAQNTGNTVNNTDTVPGSNVSDGNQTSGEKMDVQEGNNQIPSQPENGYTHEENSEKPPVSAEQEIAQ